MAFPAFTGGVANIKAAAFLAVYVKDTTSSKWQTLGSIDSGVLNIQNFETIDSVGRNRSNNALDFTAKCNMKQASLTELELLDSLCNGTNAFLFKLTDAVAITSGSVASAGWIGVTAAQVGVKAKFVADGSPDKDAHIELQWQGSIVVSDANQIALFTPSLIDTDFASSADSATAVFYTIGTYTAAKDGGNPTNTHIKPCGISTVGLDVAGGSSPVTIGPITNAKIGLDMLATQDGIRRFLPNSVDILIEYDCMATANADLLLLAGATATKDIQGIEIKATITMLSGLVITMDNQVGVHTNFEVSGDMDKNRIIRFTHKGKILQSSFDGIVS